MIEEQFELRASMCLSGEILAGQYRSRDVSSRASGFTPDESEGIGATLLKGAKQ